MCTEVVVKSNNFGNNVARELKYSSIDGGDDDEYNEINFVEISEEFVAQS